MNKLSQVNYKAEAIMEKFQLTDRIDSFKQQECYVTVKDHKEDFPTRVKNRLINPAKSHLGKASKAILDRVNTIIRADSSLRQWRSTQNVVDWFNSIGDKKKNSVVKFDIVEFYPSISEKTFKRALSFAREFTNITKDEEKILMNSREAFICLHNELWAKKEGGSFDVTMGSFDGAEVAELVGLLLLCDIQPLLPTAGLYRDDGLGPNLEQRWLD